MANNADKAKAATGNGGPKSILLPAGMNPHTVGYEDSLDTIAWIVWTLA